MHYEKENIATFFGQGQKAEREYTGFVCLLGKSLFCASRLFGRHAFAVGKHQSLIHFAVGKNVFVKAI